MNDGFLLVRPGLEDVKEAVDIVKGGRADMLLLPSGCDAVKAVVYVERGVWLNGARRDLAERDGRKVRGIVEKHPPYERG